MCLNADGCVYPSWHLRNVNHCTCSITETVHEDKIASAASETCAAFARSLRIVRSLDWILCERESWIKPFLCHGGRAHRQKRKQGLQGERGTEIHGGMLLLPLLSAPTFSSRSHGFMLFPNMSASVSKLCALKYSLLRKFVPNIQLLVRINTSSYVSTCEIRS